MMRPSRFRAVALVAATVAAACGGNSSTSPFAATPSITRLTGIVPAGGATGVDPAAPFVMSFSRSMQAGSQMYVSLHEGTATGAGVTGTATWSADSTRLSFTATAPLKSQMAYALHLGGNMMDNRDSTADVGTGVQCGRKMATSQMMSGGMMGGTEMGAGWQTPGSNTCGMIFTCTTR